MAEAAGTTHAPAPAGADGRPSPSRFTALELAAAEHLIHLSESSSSAAACFTPRGPASVGSASSTSSPRSVNAPAIPRALAALAAAEEGDDDEQEVGGRPRRNKRYRPIAEIYAATAPKRKTKPIGARGGRKDRPKPAAGAGKEAAMRK
ncbi:hypothetical protein EJB05_47776, partial [Eragrostis curvula]